jgi:hypothetical protein
MSGKRVPIGSRPNPERWIAARDGAAPRADMYTARLTIDVTPALRSRIKLIAFSRGLTVAEMLRGMLEREFPEAPSQVTGADS